MKTAHFSKNTKYIFSFAGFLSLLTILSLLKISSAFAQAASNPFISDQNTNIIEIEPTLYNDTDATKTIAQEQVALTAIPPRLGDDGSLSAAPGEKLQVQLRVRNISEQTVNVVTSSQDFILDQDGETPIAIDDSGSNRWSLTSWLTITPTEHEISPKSTAGINVLIEIPEDALPGGHYAMILHQPGQLNDNGEFSLDSGESSSAINQRVGTLLYVVVEGPINEEAYIRDFNFPSFSEYGPLPFEFVVENNSDVHITPQMSIEIYNMFNQKIETIAVEPKNIFPLANRSFSGKWDRVWGLGLYKAKLTMSYGTSGSLVIANTNFWLLPVKIIIALIVILLTIIITTLSVKRHLKHRKEMDAKKISDLEAQIQEMQTGENKENL